MITLDLGHLKFNDSVLGRDRKGKGLETHRGEGRVKTEAEPGGMWSKSKDASSHRKPREGKGQILPWCLQMEPALLTP